MGMFDSVMVPCPKCETPVEFQSKAGDCQMDRYTLEDAPAELLLDIMNEPHYCQNCGEWVALVDPRYPPGEKPKPDLRAARVKAPENSTTHFQGMKWWPDEVPFTFDDLLP